MKADTATSRNLLTEAIFETFEKMFFLFLEPTDRDPEGCDLESAVQFKGSVGGRLEVFLPRKLAAAMVSNMLSCGTEDVTDAEIEDCAMEAANVICGSFLRRLDRRGDFNLSTPSFRRVVGVDRNESQREGMIKVCFESDRGGLSVRAVLSEDQRPPSGSGAEEVYGHTVAR